MRERKVGGSSRLDDAGRSGGSWPGKRAATDGLTAPTADQSSGAPLPGGLRHDLESALGENLAAVRVHTGGDSASSADALNARAFAVGQDIHFGAGEFEPSTTAGQHLIAHEVAHTVQQQGTSPEVQRYTTVSAPGDVAEQQADGFASAFVSGGDTHGLVTRGVQTSATIHRFGRDEHAAIPTTYLVELYDHLKTPEGKKWAKDHGYQDPADLIRRMEADPVVAADTQARRSGHHGDHAGQAAKIRGAKTTFTYGEVTAMMGDLFGHWSSLYNADEEQRSHLMGEDTTQSNEKYTKGEYLKLAAKNHTHFAGENRKAWLEHHDLAIDAAMRSGQESDPFNKEDLMEQAYLIEAAGAHFLTDAFASGHQFEKMPVMAAIQIELKKNPLRTANAPMQTLVAIADLDDPTNIANLMVKAIHDKLNQEGFPVTNGRGMTWRTFGDGYLEKSEETQRIAALAVFESRQQVIKAQSSKTRPNPEDVADFFPNVETRERANDYALAHIPYARQRVEQILYEQRKDAPAKFGPVGGAIITPMLEAIGDPTREDQILRDQEFDRRTGGDGSHAVAPQFEWRF